MLRDRKDAGKKLAAILEAHANENTLVLALPRGGVPVAFEIARRLKLPMDVFLVRKLGVPGHEELAFGAIASGGVRVLNREVMRDVPHARAVLEAVTAREMEELQRRSAVYRGAKPFPRLKGRDIILVDDGLATGATMRAALAALRLQGPRRITVALPVAEAGASAKLRKADAVVCLMQPEPFYSVGSWYRNFDQTSDAEVCALMHKLERYAQVAA
ncbi:MAG: phosphoribosyltransferase [Proteobacteria bacterium]|nr:phosphoribosyltransferase [Pseudomonadota bacterium]